VHESGVIRRMLAAAQAEAGRQGGALAGIHVRLGVLAGGSPEHLREHFEHEAEALGLVGVSLTLVHDPEWPAGVEITGIDVRR